MYEYFDLFWHYLARWVVLALGVAIVGTVTITMISLLWYIFLPLFLLGLGIFLIRLALA